MICAEEWGFQILAIIAGIIGVSDQAAQTLIVSWGAIIFMAPLGIQEATCGIIGNCIGANNVPLAKRFFYLGLKVNFIVTFTLSLLTFVFRESIADFFTADAEIRHIASNVLILLSFNFLADGMQGFLQAPIRAMGL